MCGIAGIIGMQDKLLIQKMASAIHHRGPSQDEFFLDQNISLGYKRLSIIDTTQLIHPIISNSSKTLFISVG